MSRASLALRCLPISEVLGYLLKVRDRGKLRFLFQITLGMAVKVHLHVVVVVILVLLIIISLEEDAPPAAEFVGCLLRLASSLQLPGEDGELSAVAFADLEGLCGCPHGLEGLRLLYGPVDNAHRRAIICQVAVATTAVAFLAHEGLDEVAKTQGGAIIFDGQELFDARCQAALSRLLFFVFEGSDLLN